MIGISVTQKGRQEEVSDVLDVRESNKTRAVHSLMTREALYLYLGVIPATTSL
jgi:hypothetical protein